MRLRKLAAFAVVAAALGLSACGGSGFKSKVTEVCEKEGGKMMPGAGAVDCACAANIMDAELPGDVKDFFLKMLEIKDDPSKAKDIDQAEMMEKLQKLQEVGDKMNERILKECKKG